MPGRGQGAGFGFAIPNNASDNQIRIIEGCTESMAQRIAKLPALVDGAGRFGRSMTGDAARKRELFEQPLNPASS